MTIYGQNQGYFKREKNYCIGTGARTKLHKIKRVVFSLQCMWCYDTFFVTKYVIMTSQWNINYSSVSQKLNLRSCGMKSPNNRPSCNEIMFRNFGDITAQLSCLCFSKSLSISIIILLLYAEANLSTVYANMKQSQ